MTTKKQEKVSELRCDKFSIKRDTDWSMTDQRYDITYFGSSNKYIVSYKLWEIKELHELLTIFLDRVDNNGI